VRHGGYGLLNQLATSSGAVTVHGRTVLGQHGKHRRVMNLDPELGQHAEGLVENLPDKFRSE
jgi:hypothetical protein